jgi:Mrp family chromosome partitioning ATPase
MDQCCFYGKHIAFFRDMRIEFESMPPDFKYYWGGGKMESFKSRQHSKNKTKGNLDKERAVRSSLEKIKNKFLIMSGKGGVGKTSVSANLAMALANKGYKVGLMDIDIHGPDVPRMVGLTGMLEGTSDQKLIPIKYSPNLSVVSIESLMPNKDDAVIWRGPMKHSAIRQFVGDVLWGELDYMIIDSPPGTGDEPLSVAQTISDAQAIIVTTPQEVALADVRKSIAFCNSVNMAIYGVIENMSGFVCPHCKQTVSLFGSGGGRRTAQAYNLRFLGQIPFDLNLVISGDKGLSFQKIFKNSEAAKAFDKIAQQLMGGKDGG